VSNSLARDGFYVAAGIPTTEKAAGERLTEASVRRIFFEPGSVDGIRQVSYNAAFNPSPRYPPVGRRTLRNLTADWLHRIEESLAGVNGDGQVPPILQSFTSLN